MICLYFFLIISYLCSLDPLKSFLIYDNLWVLHVLPHVCPPPLHPSSAIEDPQTKPRFVAAARGIGVWSLPCSVSKQYQANIVEMQEPGFHLIYVCQSGSRKAVMSLGQMPNQRSKATRDRIQLMVPGQWVFALAEVPVS